MSALLRSHSHTPTATVTKLRIPLTACTEAEDAGVEDWEVGAEVDDDEAPTVEAADEDERLEVEEIDEDVLVVLFRKELQRSRPVSIIAELLSIASSAHSLVRSL